MSHDSFNTRGGTVGFEVELADGSVVREDQSTWDEVVGPVRQLSLTHLRTGHRWLTLRGYDAFLFSNIASAARSVARVNPGTHRGKILGGCNGDAAVLLTVVFDGERPVVSRTDCARSELLYEQHAFKRGI